MMVGSEVNGQLIKMTAENNDILNLENEVIEESDTFKLEQKANLD